MIAIVDYGLGNVSAFANVYRRLDIPALVVKQPADLAGATKLILPGVGAFDHAMERLAASGMQSEITNCVRNLGMPVLGVCVGMQMLAESSEEGVLPGLGWIAGKVRKFDVTAGAKHAALPHMGWNDVEPVAGSGLFAGLESDARFYFLHSYLFECTFEENVLARTQYGARFSSAVHQDNVLGVQFHPEKSHHFGAQLLKNFATL